LATFVVFNTSIYIDTGLRLNVGFCWLTFPIIIPWDHHDTIRNFRSPSCWQLDIEKKNFDLCLGTNKSSCYCHPSQERTRSRGQCGACHSDQLPLPVKNKVFSYAKYDGENLSTKTKDTNKTNLNQSNTFAKSNDKQFKWNLQSIKYIFYFRNARGGIFIEIMHYIKKWIYDC